MPRTRKLEREKGQLPITSLFSKLDKPGESSKVKADKPHHTTAPLDNEPVNDVEYGSSVQQDADSDDEEMEVEEDVVEEKEKDEEQNEEDGDEEDEDEGQEDGDEDDEAVEGVEGSTIENSDLPPIHHIPSIFSDLVSRVPQVKAVVDHLGRRKLRVATMCSGTESPLLALSLIQRYIPEHFGVSLDYEHVFSCEIEPFKQAYIERNFQPPILFRDVCELSRDRATTAYGALVDVPGNVDLLIAGTSCVDYSNLNKKKQSIDANGESGRTFRGMLSWVRKNRPPLVILENVCGAPWTKVIAFFEQEGYSAAFLKLDTKAFYIPHTRHRKYLFAVNKANSSFPTTWTAKIQELKRPASSTLDAFLLPTDDSRIHQARQKLANEARDTNGNRRGRTDWGRCESRHQRARLEEHLGAKRPLTGWGEGGSCKLPDFAWNDWGVGQVERVWDLMDISLLRSATKGVDPSYKTQVWNLSQNVDRSTGSSKPGLSPCLTPTMIPYITNRGGPMIGLEALSMQGLPIDELLLTRETEDQLADLAGNAMSTTVVGACILAALVVGRKLLKEGSKDHPFEQAPEDRIVEDGPNGMNCNEDEIMEVDLPVDDIDTHITGEDQLTERPLNLAASVSQLSLAGLLDKAHRSARLCDCEGRKDMTDRPLNRCVDCYATSCDRCGGRPEHNYQPIDLAASPRLPPSTFEEELKMMLPMSLSISNVAEQVLNATAASHNVNMSASRFKEWRAAVLRATAKELRFVETKRQETWSFVYQAPSARLELSLHPQQPQWRLFAFPEDSAPANADIRRVLQLPVARFVCTSSLFEGHWEWALPSVAKVDIEIEGGDELVPAWEQKLGLQGEEFKNRMVHAQLEVRIPAGAASAQLFDRDVSGTYTLIDKCGTANAALHKRVPAEGDVNLPPIFLLLDPTRCGQPSGDAFVFSTSTRRYEYGESRPIIATLEPKWRQSDVVGVQHVKCILPCRWVEAKDVKLTPASGHDAVFATPAEGISINISQDACKSANALLVSKIRLGADAGPEWSQLVYKEIDKVHERSTFRALAWLTERIRNIDGHFAEWQEVDNQDHGHDGENGKVPCRRCAPVSPDILWAKGKKGKVTAFEDVVQAGEFERSLKRRPSPFVTQLKVDGDGVGILRIGVNITSLMHRALSRLPTFGRGETPTLAWRLNTDFTPAVKISLPKFKLISNRPDTEHAQPPSFEVPLRPEQLRSLTWMLEQEKQASLPFIEEEISEAILEPLGWRAEGRAQRAHHVRGGVLADEVGYGKTAISLGLIDCAAADVEREFKKAKRAAGYIATKATLIIVPPHLTGQWTDEVRKFTGTRFNVITLHTASNLKSLTIQRVVDADLVIVASNLFRSSVYLDNLEAIAGAGELPTQDGRFFDARLDIVLKGLAKQVERLRNLDQGAKAVMHQIKEGREIDDALRFPAQTKRLRGKSYRNAAETMESSDTRPSTSKAEPGEESNPRRSRQAAKRKAIAISDNEEAGNDIPKKRPAKRPRESNDDEGEELKGKGKENVVLKKARTTPARPECADAMDVDDTEEESKSSGKGKKRKQKMEAKPPKEKKRREDSDPWKLNSSSVQSHWKKMQSPPLEMFHFARKIVDEYTYLDGKVLSMVTSVKAERHWVLSGTPPIHDFGALKTISAFLNIHLGIDDDNEGQSLQVKKRKREQTAVEKFHSFREVHSLEWHAHRHQLGQRFLDQFVRQNVAEIDEISWGQEIQKVTLPAAERAIYLELEHYLRAIDMTVKRGKKSESDREKRLAQALGDSSTAEEALLKRCSHFELETSDKENAMKACEVIVWERKKQLEDCKKELLKKLKKAVEMEKNVGPTPEESHFREYIRVTRTKGVGDQEATEVMQSLLDTANIPDPPKPTTNQPEDGNNLTGSTSRRTKKETAEEKAAAELRWAHREQTHELRRLTKELVGRVRSLRYFTVVRDLQKQADVPPVVYCPGCDRNGVPAEEIAVLSSCGHTGCYACVMACAGREECVHAQLGACRAAARRLNVVKGGTLGVDDEARDGRGKHYGRKLEKVMDLIKHTIPENERVLIFVQFPDLTAKVAEALAANKIAFLEIKGSASMKSKNLQKFQNDSEERVLLLNVMDESASGANLTSANHVIFLSPLLTMTQEIYEACETQAIGRVRRYGQLKHVNIWRFFSLNTIDVEIYEQRTKQRVE
ncbi:hypothetical protein GSI_12601 [Ganoderma sinense ZZ0214-1]|uniref:Helicase ATP-binding domain-containing protein n=1 Tax=Ganoderma sinense ZZ0214-1 TaxID=1077348 RepID=A0A2G8RT74_9APHY|nr:hypothetical protein GSI_12601 [Ganoderma sinense ZZ0214-1]